MKTSGTIRLINATFYAHHGVMREERQLGNRYEVDVSMRVDFDKAGASDTLADTVDYFQVYDLVRKVITENKFYLIERVAYLIGHGVMNAHPQIEATEVTVRKYNPPVGGTIDRTEAVFSVER